jgi:hypothetical protein
MGFKADLVALEKSLSRESNQVSFVVQPVAQSLF